MDGKTSQLLRTDFKSFVTKAFAELHDDSPFEHEPYVDLVCHKLSRVVDGITRRLIVNLPPRHGKTFLCSVCFAAYLLGRQPSKRLLIVTHSDTLAEEIAYNVRLLLKCAWYQKTFEGTRLAKDRSERKDFKTTRGGAVYATSIDGKFTGRGADLIICDDLVDIDHAANAVHQDAVKQRLETKILSRLNSPKDGAVVVVAHRLAINDVCGYLIQQGGWKLVRLPLVAVTKKTYDLGHRKWLRAKGELLRPGAFTTKLIQNLRKRTVSPDFEALYQQSPEKRLFGGIKRQHFHLFDEPASPGPVIFSIDPGLQAGANSSYSVVQAWRYVDKGYRLIDQWRGQCGFREVIWAIKEMRQRWSPRGILVEATAMGPALIEEFSRKKYRTTVYAITPDGRSKVERLAQHANKFRQNRVSFPYHAPWLEQFIEEFVNFPAGKFDDQVDATTQFLDWTEKHEIPDHRPRPAAGVCLTHGGQQLTHYEIFFNQTRGAVLARPRLKLR